MAMLHRLHKLWRRLRQLFFARKVWQWPKKSQVLIFDAVGFDVLEQYFRHWDPAVLCLRGEEINVPILLASLVRSGNKAQAYIDAYIENVAPKVLVTFIDNDIHFMSLKKRHPSVKTIIVQNGWKSFHADIFEMLHGLQPSRQAELQVDYLLTFGRIVGEEYVRHIGGELVSVGSVKNNHVICNQAGTPGVMVFISQWHPEGFVLDGRFCTHDAFFRQVDTVVLQCLVDYAAKNGKRLLIVTRNGEDSPERYLEEAYFRSIVGPQCHFAMRQGQFPSYAAIDAAEVVVAVDTTLGYEAIARGRKSAIFSIRSAMLGIPGLTYGWPGRFAEDGLYWTNRPDSSAFVRILDYLFKVDPEQWTKDVDATGFGSLMIYNPGNSILKSVIKEKLGLEQLVHAGNHSCSTINPS